MPEPVAVEAGPEEDESEPTLEEIAPVLGTSTADPSPPEVEQPQCRHQNRLNFLLYHSEPIELHLYLHPRPQDCHRCQYLSMKI